MFTTKLEVILTSLIVLLLSLGGFAWFERDQGAKQCMASDASASLKNEEKQADERKSQSAEVAREVADYANALNTPLVHVPVLVCAPPAPAAGKVRTARASARSGDASANADPGHADGAVQGVAIGPGVLGVAKRGQAQILVLQDYIRRVCLKQD